MTRPLQEILPWNNGELEKLLRGLIAHGTETAKVDFKAEVETGTPEQKAELLKDITAVANTYDEANGDHGFLIYGVKAKAIVGVATTETDTDKFQNTIEQLLKTYVSPMPQIYVIGFEEPTGKKWGAIIIPPRNSKPHMFCKDLSCPTNQTKSRKRGEWFVRRGATTDPGLPEDLALITQKQMALLLEPLHESIRSLQARVGKTEQQYNDALFKLVERAVSALPAPASPDEERSPYARDIIGLDVDLSSRIKARLRTPKDAIAEDLIAEAKAVRDYLDGAETGLPWAPQLNNQAESKKVVDDMEEKVRELQRSIGTIVLSDTKGVYTDVLLRAVKMLAKVPEIPTGTPYNRVGQSLRYYPLGLILYTIFVCGVATGKSDLLKRVMQIPVKHPGRTETSDMTDIFFYWYDAGALFNDATGQRRCAPIAERIRQTIRDNVGEMITEFSEPEYFFRGEFVLALTRIDVGMTHGEGADHRVPLAGLYLYMHEGNEPITGLLLEHPDWLDKIYDHPLNELLDMFDRNANKMSNSGCFAMGLHGLKTRAAYDESLQRRAKKV
ncbi:MAG TPA: ATP-binding protein [Candidatus Paceibacterota bacterium]|nr:ATP-binding protein [Candidatus Paceibacterota bacterium]